MHPLATTEGYGNTWESFKRRGFNHFSMAYSKQGKSRCLTAFDLATKIVSGVRNFRKERNISYKEALQLYVVAKEDQVKYHALIQKMAGVKIHWAKSSSSVWSKFPCRYF